MAFDLEHVAVGRGTSGCPLSVNEISYPSDMIRLSRRKLTPAHNTTVITKYAVRRNTWTHRTVPLFWAVPAPVTDATVVSEDDSGICSINEPISSNRAEVDDAIAECSGSSTVIRRARV